MEGLSTALVQVIVSLVTVIGTLVATLVYYLPRRDRNRHSNPGDNSTLKELLREFREASKADSEHHASEVQWQQEVMRAFQRIEAKL